MARPESGREPGNFRKAWSFLAPGKNTSKEASANFQSVPEDPLQTGTKYFISASKEYAASVTAQSAAIAQMCQNSGQNPAELRDTLVSNPDRLEQIASAANSLHTRAKVQNPYLTTPEKVRHEKVEEIITKDFSIAEQMMGLSAKDLRKLLGKYKKYRFEDNELGYRLEAYHLLESKGSQNADYILDGSPAEQTVVKRILPTDIDSNPREGHQLAILPEVEATTFLPTEQATAMKSFIDEGLELITQGGYNVVETHFTSAARARDVGVYWLEFTRYQPVERLLTERDLVLNVRAIALKSKPSVLPAFAPEGKLLGGTFDNPELFNPELVQRFYYEVGLLHAEEWLHTLQARTNSSVAGHSDMETDVAAYLDAHGMNLSADFITRYPERAEWFINERPERAEEIRAFLQEYPHSYTIEHRQDGSYIIQASDPEASAPLPSMEVDPSAKSHAQLINEAVTRHGLELSPDRLAKLQDTSSYETPSAPFRINGLRIEHAMQDPAFGFGEATSAIMQFYRSGETRFENWSDGIRALQDYLLLVETGRIESPPDVLWGVTENQSLITTLTKRLGFQKKETGLGIKVWATVEEIGQHIFDETLLDRYETALSKLRNTVPAEVAPGTHPTATSDSTAGEISTGARAEVVYSPSPREAHAPQEERIDGEERKLSEPEYFSYLETLGEYSGITVINSETGSIHESGVEGAIPLHLDPRAGTDAVVKAIVSIQKRTPRSSGSETTEEDMSGMTEEQLLKKLEKTILVHGIHSLPRTLGKNGWNEEARKALSLKEGDNRSIYEMLAPEIDKLNAARSATTDPDMISNVELQFAVILQDLIAKIPYAIKGGASRKQIESKQEVNCVGSDELALVLEEADIQHAVTRLAKHDLVFALTANGSIYVIDPRNPHPKFRLSNRSMQAVGTDGKPVSVSDIAGYIDTASPEGLRITVDPDFYSQIHPDPRPNETDFWMVIGSPENTLAADVLHHISVNLPPDSHQAKLFAASLMSDLAPQVATSHRVKSRVFFESGQYDIALNEINRAIDLDKGSDSSRAHRGLIYLYGFRNYKAAFDDFSAAAELNPDNAGHWKNLATVYRHLGLYEQEEQCLTMANDIYPNNSDLQRLLAKAHIASVLEKDIHSGLDRIENGHLDQPVQASHDEELTDKVETALHANLEGQQQSDVVVDKGAEYQRQVGTDSGEIPLERRDSVEAIAQGDKSPTGSVPAELEKGHKITSGEDAQERGTELDSDTSSSVRQLQPEEPVALPVQQPKPDEQAEPSVDGGEKQLEQPDSGPATIYQQPVTENHTAPDAEAIPPVTQPAQAPVPEEEMPERQAPPVTPTDAPESKVNPSDKPEVPQQDKKELEPPPVTTDAPVPREEAEKQPVPPEPTHPAEPEQIVPSPEEHSAPEPEQDLDSQGDAAAKTFNDLETNGNDHGRIELPEPPRQEPPAPDPVPSPSQDSRVPVTEHDIIKQIDNGNNTNGE